MHISFKTSLLLNEALSRLPRVKVVQFFFSPEDQWGTRDDVVDRVNLINIEERELGDAFFAFFNVDPSTGPVTLDLFRVEFLVGQ